jgi:prevent-host-death family protein
MRDHLTVSKRREPIQKFVGVRELKTNAARILREVRDSRASFILTHRGRAVGVILPCDLEERSQAANDSDPAAAWNAFIQAGRHLQRQFRPGMSSVRVLSETRG